MKRMIYPLVMLASINIVSQEHTQAVTHDTEANKSFLDELNALASSCNSVELATTKIRRLLKYKALTQPENSEGNTQIAIQELAQQLKFTPFTIAAYIKTPESKQWIANQIQKSRIENKYMAQKAMEEALGQPETKTLGTVVHILVNIAAPFSMESKYARTSNGEIIEKSDAINIITNNHKDLIITAQIDDNSNLHVMRLDADGKTVDTTYGCNGTLSFRVPNTTKLYSMITAPSGTSYIAYGTRNTNKVNVVAISQNGTPDTSHGKNFNGLQTITTRQPVDFFKLAEPGPNNSSVSPYTFAVRFSEQQ